MNEIRNLKYFPGYGVTIDGEVWSYKGEEPIRLQEINHAYDYDVVNLTKEDGKRATVLIHQLVMEAWGVPRPRPFSEHVITHLDRNKKNNRLDNLRWIRKDEIRANKSLPVRAIGIDEGDKILFRTTTDAAKYFRTNQVKIRDAIIAGKIWRGYKFEYIEK